MFFDGYNFHKPLDTKFREKFRNSQPTFFAFSISDFRLFFSHSFPKDGNASVNERVKH